MPKLLDASIHDFGSIMYLTDEGKEGKDDQYVARGPRDKSQKGIELIGWFNLVH